MAVFTQYFLLANGKEIVRHLLLLAITLSQIGATNVSAQAIGEGTRSLTLDSRYFNPEYSNRAHGQFGIEIMSIGALPASLLLPIDTERSDRDGFPLSHSWYWNNFGNGVLTLIGSAFLSTSYQFSYHEFGHGTRAAAAGFRPHYGHGSIDTGDDIAEAIRRADTKGNFFSFFLSSLTDVGGYTIATGDDTLFPPLTPDEFFALGWDGVVAAAGLNNEMYFTEFIEDEIARNGGHIGYLISYASGKMSANAYSLDGTVFNDKNNIVQFYNDRNLAIGAEDVDQGSVRAFFLSASSYQLTFQLLRMFSGRSTRFQGWKPYGIELPNTSFYMNTAGLSYKIRSGYNYGAWRWPVALEFVYSGDSRAELFVGAERVLFGTFVSLGMTVGEVIAPQLDLHYGVHDNVRLTAGYSYYNRKNLRGERSIPSLEHGDGFHEVYAGVAVVY